jgi:heme/copper-type cytochrome/quinol oxidase subunit 2
MGKIKSVILILVGAFLSLFIYENWVAAPYIKLFGREIVQLNISIIILIFSVLGFILGILTHLAWIHRRRKTAAMALGGEQAPEAQSPEQQEENKE